MVKYPGTPWTIKGYILEVILILVFSNVLFAYIECTSSEDCKSLPKKQHSSDSVTNRWSTLEFDPHGFYCSRTHECHQWAQLCTVGVNKSSSLGPHSMYKKYKLPHESKKAFKKRKKAALQEKSIDLIPLENNGGCRQFVRFPSIDSVHTSHITVPNASSLGRFFWLHVPKCGSTFETTLYLWACPGPAFLSSLAVSQQIQSVQSNHTSYRSEVVQHIKNYFASDAIQAKLWCEASDKRGKPHEPWKKQGPMFALIREPHQRLISAFKNHLHSFGMSKSSHLMMKIAVDEAISENLNGKGQLRALEIFSNWPGIRSCTVKMLTGVRCASNITEGESEVKAAARTQMAIKTLLDRRKTPFFGITDLYNSSLCLFHAMVGGQDWDVEWLNIHPTTTNSQTTPLNQLRRKPTASEQDQSGNPWDLEGFDINDPHDQILYNAGLEEFNRRLLEFSELVVPCCEKHGCTPYYRSVVEQMLKQKQKFATRFEKLKQSLSVTNSSSNVSIKI